MALCFVSIEGETQIKFEEINPLLLGAMDSVHVPVPGLASHLLQGVETLPWSQLLLPGHQR